MFTTRRSGFATRREGEAEISLGGLLGSLARFGKLIPTYQLKFARAELVNADGLTLFRILLYTVNRDFILS